MKRALFVAAGLCVFSCSNQKSSNGPQGAGSGGSLPATSTTDRGSGGSATGGTKDSATTGSTGYGGAGTTAGSTAGAAARGYPCARPLRRRGMGQHFPATQLRTLHGTKVQKRLTAFD